MKCITFRRWYPGTNRNVLSNTYPIETDAHKLSLAHLIYCEREGEFSRAYVCGRLDETVVSIACDSEQGYHLKRCLQFFQMTYDEDEEEGDNSLTFFFSSDEEKLAFANWVIEHKLGDFRHDNAHIFISEMYVPAVGRAVTVPIAEPAPIEPAE